MERCQPTCSDGYRCVGGACVEDPCSHVGCPLGQKCTLDSRGRAQCTADWVIEPEVTDEKTDEQSAGAGGLQDQSGANQTMERLGGGVIAETVTDGEGAKSEMDAEAIDGDAEAIGCSLHATEKHPPTVWLGLFILHLCVWRRRLVSRRPRGA